MHFGRKNQPVKLCLYEYACFVVLINSRNYIFFLSFFFFTFFSVLCWLKSWQENCYEERQNLHSVCRYQPESADAS